MTKRNVELLMWATPILATITAILDAGHLSNIIPSEVSVLVLAIITAIVGFIAATAKPDEEDAKVQQLPHPQAQQQPPPQPQKK